MIETIILALLIAKLRKYRLKPLLKEWSIYPVAVLAVIYIYLDYMVYHGEYGLLKYSMLLKAAYMCIFSILIFKHRLYRAGFIGAASISFGGILNSIAIHANGGNMPVFPSLSYVTGYVKPDTFQRLMEYDKIHVLGSLSSRLVFLTDTIDLGYSILSIGDVFFRVMPFVIIYGVVKSLNGFNSTVIHETM